jgi:hypothetical protein
VSINEQIYYEALVRTDHPVFRRDFSEITTINSSLNSIHNRVMAKQLVKMKSIISEVRSNIYPSTVTSLTIDDWEFNYFGFTKPSLSISQRVEELLIKFNKRFTMSVQDVIDISRAIVGVTPIVTRNANLSGWVLGNGYLGSNTILGGSGSLDSIGLYLVLFPTTVDTSLLDKLDERLTIIEKAGSRHRIKSVIPRWVLGKSVIGISTILGA